MSSEFRIPPVQNGPIAPEAARWARLIMLFDWACAKDGNRLKGEILPTLVSKRPLREPCLHTTDRVNGVRFYNQIGDSLRHVEAAAAQVTGNEAPVPCTHCQGKHGKFTQCVIMYVAGNQTCASCYWGGRYKECSFYKATSDSTPPQVRVNDQSQPLRRTIGHPILRALTNRSAREECAGKLQSELQDLKREINNVKSRQESLSVAAAATKNSSMNAQSLVENSETISRVERSAASVLLNSTAGTNDAVISENARGMEDVLGIEAHITNVLEEIIRALKL
ncbi:hypothetical protein N7456_000998 [Penicillium angulare]|uniref:Uncharacterized protein n=1 Tax=Penicillium angulare TaxID=116970 RepID=A0A9W9GE70_9EURO|nr:hypothetical protein N7456_000998 [Penicillium angulare]